MHTYVYKMLSESATASAVIMAIFWHIKTINGHNCSAKILPVANGIFCTHNPNTIDMTSEPHENLLP